MDQPVDLDLSCPLYIIARSEAVMDLNERSCDDDINQGAGRDRHSLQRCSCYCVPDQ